MELGKRVTLDRLRADLEHEVPDAAEALAVLEKAELELTSVRRVGRQRDSSSKPPCSWLAHLRLPEPLAQSFSLAPQLLVVFSPFHELHLKDIDAAERELAASRRLDRSLVLCFTGDPDAERRAAPTLPVNRKYRFLSFSMARAAPDPKRWMREYLRDTFAPARLFSPGRLVSGWDFMGREREVQELARMVLGEGRPAGVFGLRRMGKTSLIRHWKESLLEGERGVLPEAILLSLDLTTVAYSEKNPTGFFRRLLAAAQDWRREVGAASQKLSGRSWAKVDVNDPDISAPSLQRMGEAAIDDLIRFAAEHGRRLVLVLDEYEELLEDEGIQNGLVLLAWMKGLYQQYPQHFCFVVAGLDRGWLRKPRLHGRQNPLLGIVKDLPLAGLSRQDLGSLVGRIGRRAQLDFDHQSVDVVYAESGGHPFLARQICDLLDQRIPVAERLPARVGAARIKDVLPRFDHEINQLMPELLKAARDLAELSPEQLVSIAVGTGTAELDPIALEDLESYGILARDQSGRWIHRIGALARWLRANYDVPLAAAGGAG